MEDESEKIQEPRMREELYLMDVDVDFPKRAELKRKP